MVLIYLQLFTVCTCLTSESIPPSSFTYHPSFHPQSKGSECGDFLEPLASFRAQVGIAMYAGLVAGKYSKDNGYER